MENQNIVLIPPIYMTIIKLQTSSKTPNQIQKNPTKRSTEGDPYQVDSSSTIHARIRMRSHRNIELLILDDLRTKKFSYRQ